MVGFHVVYGVEEVKHFAVTAPSAKPVEMRNSIDQWVGCLGWIRWLSRSPCFQLRGGAVYDRFL